jgi:glyoxylase-like metal-dependent hydrolase (beta-lactamase superfamily II)
VHSPSEADCLGRRGQAGPYQRAPGEQGVRDNHRINLIVETIEVSNSFFRNLCYVVACKEKGQALIVDPAWDFESIDHVLQRLAVVPAGILLTHSHIDHVHLADVFAARDRGWDRTGARHPLGGGLPAPPFRLRGGFTFPP